MDKKKILLIALAIVVIIVAIGGVVFFVTQQNTPPPSSTTGVVPATPSPASLTLTVQPSSPTIAASSSASLDVFLNTGGVAIDGFQFIATLNGSSSPTVTDTDPATTGIQIEPSTGVALTPVTNSVVNQNGDQVIRYAMITQDASQSFSNTAPTKVATIHFTTATNGTAQISFDTQNTRANRTGSTQETLIAGATQSFTITSAIATSPIASSSGTLATAPSPSPALIAKAASSSVNTKPNPTPTLAPSCNAACLSSSDCSSGLSCINNACVNVACPGSASCTCTATPTPKATATPKPTTTPTPLALAQTTRNGQFSDTSINTIASSSASDIAAGAVTTQPKVASIAALPASLPVTGGIEDTFMLLLSGVACVTVAGVLMLWMF
ncbi:hypothetical protein C5B42_01090 [Candidatus Cerribacteria bacterium 'Amazon FNV 2010 28 9']|uniref:Uncharacterized protein n=1 Tax=Candidatus Cerribacteria bacterium 'Amazon FNV 2010 28 9' TaxID=2081795 RepID=A0A317JR74_9BACT|nr:MAG: hypothetical protein C5B42_01090 [Candidatus Cerribacteria bacterium 'Amazon FNV 2010 28 9']